MQCYWKPYTSDSSTLTFTYQSDRPNLELRQERGTFCRVIRILRIKWKQRSKTDYTPCLAWSESHCYVPRYFGLPRSWKNPWVTNSSSAAHKKKYSIKDFFSKCKSADLVTFYWRSPQWKTSFFVQWFKYVLSIILQFEQCQNSL